jgi:polyhydroxybutyrate depolymerase
MKLGFITTLLGGLCAAALSGLNSLSAEGKPVGETHALWKSGVHHLVFGGIDRTFNLDVPRVVRPGAPLVMVFHGFTGSAKGVRELAGFTPLVEKYGFVAVYPQGTIDSKGRAFFNVGYEFHWDQKVDDAEFARGLAARLVRDLGLDERAVFATGFSNGGDMSFFLGAQKNPFVSAIAPVAGTMMESWARDFRPVARISVLAVNAKHDRTTLWDGDMKNRDGWGAYLGTEAVLGLWVKGLGLTNVNRVAPTPSIRMTRWSSVADNTEVKFVVLGVGGHEWPRDLGDEANPTAEVIWRFFDDHHPKSH